MSKSRSAHLRCRSWLPHTKRNTQTPGKPPKHGVLYLHQAGRTQNSGQVEEIMKRLFSWVVLSGLCASPALAIAQSYDNVPIVDVNCSRRAAADPDSHTRDCALKCAGSGFGIVTN